MNSKYEYTDDMAEISGFGGDYEKSCRKMVIAGLCWFDDNPHANAIVKENAAIFGIVSEENEDAKNLSRAIAQSVTDCSGAMHHAAISHTLWIKKHSWDEYCETMREAKKKKDAKAK